MDWFIRINLIVGSLFLLVMVINMIIRYKSLKDDILTIQPTDKKSLYHLHNILESLMMTDSKKLKLYFWLLKLKLLSNNEVDIEKVLSFVEKVKNGAIYNLGKEQFKPVFSIVNKDMVNKKSPYYYDKYKFYKDFMSNLIFRSLVIVLAVFLLIFTSHFIFLNYFVANLYFSFSPYILTYFIYYFYCYKVKSLYEKYLSGYFIQIQYNNGQSNKVLVERILLFISIYDGFYKTSMFGRVQAKLNFVKSMPNSSNDYLPVRNSLFDIINLCYHSILSNIDNKQFQHFVANAVLKMHRNFSKENS